MHLPQAELPPDTPEQRRADRRRLFGAFNAYAGASKEIVVWPYNGHEGGALEDDQRMLATLRALF